MKVAASVRKRCHQCKIIRRKNRLFVICPVSKKHKQRQG